jgi:hypothetical protein
VCVSAVCKLTMQTIWNLQHMNVSYKNKKSVFPQLLAKRDRNAKCTKLSSRQSHLFNNCFGYYMVPYVLFHSFDVFTIILQCRK